MEIPNQQHISHFSLTSERTEADKTQDNRVALTLVWFLIHMFMLVLLPDKHLLCGVTTPLMRLSILRLQHTVDADVQMHVTVHALQQSR